MHWILMLDRPGCRGKPTPGEVHTGEAGSGMQTGGGWALLGGLADKLHQRWRRWEGTLPPGLPPLPLLLALPWTCSFPLCPVWDHSEGSQGHQGRRGADHAIHGCPQGGESAAGEPEQGVALLLHLPQVLRSYGGRVVFLLSAVQMWWFCRQTGGWNPAVLLVWVKLARDGKQGRAGRKTGEDVGVDFHRWQHQPAGRPGWQGGRVAFQPLVEIASKHSLLRPDGRKCWRGNCETSGNEICVSAGNFGIGRPWPLKAGWQVTSTINISPIADDDALRLLVAGSTAEQRLLLLKARSL